MLINRNNVTRFIAQLYRERKGQIPPRELLDSWAQLSDEDIDRNLSGLFESWGMTEADKQRAITTFMSQSAAAPSGQVPGSGFSSTPPRPTHVQQPYHTPKKKKRGLLWIILLILIPILAFSVYGAYKYVSYESMRRVYAITQNIAVRDIEGRMVGRMDLYADSAAGSYSSLRSIDHKIHYIQPEGSNKEYPSRKLIIDSVTFSDYLFNNYTPVYVNVNYIVDDRKEFNLYATAFQEIQSVDKDNRELKAAVRKVIVGSMAVTQNMEDKYLVTYAAGLNRNILNITTSLIIQAFENDQEFVIIAALNDGYFYRFEGNIQTNKYKPLTQISVVDEGKNIVPLSGQYRFTQSEGIWKLYDVTEKSTTHFDLVKDNDGRYSFFEYNPPQKIQNESNLFNTVTDVINNIFN